MGGTNTVFGIVDSRGNVISKSAIKTGTHSDVNLYIQDLYNEMIKLIDAAGGSDKIKGIGVGVYDALMYEIHDIELGKTYCALSCCNNPDYADRCTDKNAPKVIWAIQATAPFNNDMYLMLRNGFKENKINLLVSEFECEETLKDIRGYNSLSLDGKLKIQMPYIHTTLLVNELINLQHEAKGTNIKVFEKSGMRKDRVSSIGYNYWVQCQLESNLRKPTELQDFSKAPRCISTFSY